MKSPATQGVSTPPISCSQARPPDRSSIATIRPLWLTATTRPWSITGMPRISARLDRAPARRTAARLSDHADAAILGAESEQLAGGIGHGDDGAIGRRACGAQQAGGFQNAGVGPERGAVIGGIGDKLIIDGDDEDPVADHGRCGPNRPRHAGAPGQWRRSSSSATATHRSRSWRADGHRRRRHRRPKPRPIVFTLDIGAPDLLAG